MEAHYLNLLYHKQLNESLIRTLFAQSVSTFTRIDCCQYEYIFSAFYYGCFPFPAEGERTYFLKLDAEFASKSLLLSDQLDRLLGWPRDLAEIFFNYVETHPFAESLSQLTQGLGFKEWNELGGKPSRYIPTEKMDYREFLEKVEYFKLDLPKKPGKCPFVIQQKLLKSLLECRHFLS